jgi:hypothetical protein
MEQIWLMITALKANTMLRHNLCPKMGPQGIGPQNGLKKAKYWGQLWTFGQWV